MACVARDLWFVDAVPLSLSVSPYLTSLLRITLICDILRFFIQPVGIHRETPPFFATAQRCYSGTTSLPSLALAQAQHNTLRVAGGWRMNAHDYQIGALHVDWDKRQVKTEFGAHRTQPGACHRARAGRRVPRRGNTPRHLVVRVDAHGKLVHRLAMADEGDARTLDGHVIASLDGQWLYTGETDRKTGDCWGERAQRQRPAQSCRAPHTRHRPAPNTGGCTRQAGGRQRRHPAYPHGRQTPIGTDPALVLLDRQTGEKLGEWSLRDKRLAPHHIAWNRPLADGPTLLGIGLQAEHDDPDRRRDAPLLAVWDGKELTTPTHMVADGYVGDVAAGPNGVLYDRERAERAIRN